LTQQLVILVGGLLTAGKDAFADHLVDNHGFVKLGMSDTLAEALRRLNPFVPVPNQAHPVRYQKLLERDGYVGAKKNDEVRELLQKLGTEVGRELFGQNFWVDMARVRINEQLAVGHSVVLTGARFPNEIALAEYWEDDDNTIATTVWVNRPGVAQGAHASEASVSAEDFEYVLQNDGTLEQLYQRADDLLDHIVLDYVG
jgi:hypothetical protein